MTVINYQDAGVNIAAGNEAVSRIKPLVEKTFSNEVCTEIGAFGALYDLKSLLTEYHHPLLVQSIDGVGTKTSIARQMNQFDTIGLDLVSATANDIVVMGATPLTLLDYIATDRLHPEIIEQIVKGMSQACLEHGISLVGGETAEMPGTYRDHEHDLVGVVTGVVEKNQVILGQAILPGDLVYGVASSGLHTNGYSLARKLLFDVGQLTVETYHRALESTIGEVLLKPHLNYVKPVLHCLNNQVAIQGMAHITGGGMLENIPRILPKGCGVDIQLHTWPVPPIFSLLQTLGHLDVSEMFRTFNMGIGLIMVVSASMSDPLQEVFQLFPEHDLYLIGEVRQSAQKEVRII